MAHFFLFGSEVMSSGFLRGHFDRYAFNNLKTCLFESPEFVRIIRDDAHFAKAEIKENFRTLAIVPGVDSKSQLFVSFDRIGTFILKSISPYLVYNSDAPAFLLLVDDRTAAFGLDHLHSAMKLRSAITFYRSKYITGEAL